LYNLYVAGKLQEAEKLQKQVAVAEWGFGKSGINGTKWVVGTKLGYPETSVDCRRPYPKYEDAKKRQWVLSQVSGLDSVEQSL
jgi:4-hydroxy-2-oxoglutarate aldolase